MNNKIFEDNAIFLGIVGSYAYGTYIEGQSDKDEVGVCIPPKEYYLGMKKFEQADKFTDVDGNKIDKVVYNIDKAVKLMSENNPNMLDLLFLPEKCIIKTSKEWGKILEIRESFISKKCRYTFSGYAFQQFNRLSTHMGYMQAPVKKPERSFYGLPEKSVFPDTQYEVIAKISTDFLQDDKTEEFYREITTFVDDEIQKIFRKYMKEEMVQTTMPIFRLGQKEFLRTLETISNKFLKDEYLDMAQKELSYLSAYNNWKRYNQWEKNRNPKRAELEKKCGYDPKHASHLLRLSRMGIEILEGKGVNVDRTNIDKEYLLEVRLGNIPFEDIKTEYEKNEELLGVAYDKSKLSYSPDLNLIENVKMEIVENYLFGLEKMKCW